MGTNKSGELTTVQRLSHVKEHRLHSPFLYRHSFLDISQVGVTATFGLLVKVLLSSFSEEVLSLLNPFLSESQRQLIYALTSAVMLAMCRVSQLSRCMALGRELLALLAGLRKTPSSAAGTDPAAVAQTISQKAGALAKATVQKRYYTR